MNGLMKVFVSLVCAALFSGTAALAVEDLYEQNDTLATAYDLSASPGVWLSDLEGLGVQNDGDWYKIDIVANYLRVVVNCTFTNANGNIDLTLCNAAGTIVATAISSTDNEVLDLIVPAAGNYFILVAGDSSAGNYYNLQWLTIASDDQYEENDTQATAYDLSAHRGVWLSDLDGMGIQTDDDYYKVEVPEPGAVLTAECLFADGDGDIDLFLLHPSGVLLRASESGSDDESVSRFLDAGTYYLKVFGKDGEMGNYYDLRWNLEDRYEENDTKGTAYYWSGLHDAWLPDGPGWQNDDDWYEIYVPAPGGLISAECQFTNSDGDLQLELIDSSGTVLSAGLDPVSDSDVVSALVPGNRSYYLKVSGTFGAVGNTYNLRRRVDDAYETNDTLATAYDLSAERAVSLTCYLYDDDWYEITVPETGGSLSVNCEFTHADGDIELALFTSGGTLLQVSESSTDDEFIGEYLAGGTYYLRAYAYGEAAGNAYDLRWSIEDLYESNDALATAYDLSSREGQWLTEISGPGYQLDADWFKLNVPVGKLRLLVNCTFTHADGDIELELYNAAGNQVADATSSSDNEALHLTVPNSGIYYIVASGADADNAYNLRWYTIAAGDDDYEENDVQADAYDISSWAGDWLSDHGDAYLKDDDWYKIHVPAGSERVAVWCRFDDSQPSDINISLYNASGQELSWTQDSYNNQFINHVVSSAGDYYVKVHGEHNDDEYDIKWVALSPDDDVYEENDTVATAYSLYYGANMLYIGGRAIQRDTDYYSINVSADTMRLQVDCDFQHSGGNIDLALCDSSGQVLATADSLTDDETLSHIVPAGTYAFRVTGDNSGNTYTLQWDGEENSAPTDISLSNASVAEGMPVGTVIGECSTVDADLPDDTHTYSLPQQGSIFYFDGNILKTGAVLDYDTRDSYTISVRSTDRFGAFFDHYFFIAIIEDTSPTLEISSIERVGNQVIIRWPSGAGQYTVMSTTNLLEAFTAEQAGIAPTPPVNSYTGTVNSVEQKFWRIYQD